jgi:asparagine synthase (glutamine-hydrolysing)
MNKFLLIAGENEAIQRRLDAFQNRLSSAASFARVLSTPCCLVVAEHSLPSIVVQGGCSICLGYWHGTSQLHADLTSVALEKAIRAGTLWGDYVAAFPRADGSTAIFTSPFGQIRIYRAQAEGVHILSNSLECILAAGELHPPIDWGGLRRFIAEPEYRPAETCLDGINRVAPGCTVELARTVREQHWWTPSDHLGEGCSTEASLGEQLSDVASACVSSWAKLFNKPMIEVSGGLDSSIIAGILSRVDSTLITTCPSNMEGDERHFARSLARHIDKPLVEFAVHASEFNVDGPIGPLLPQPGPHIVARHFDRLISNAAQMHGNDVFFNGGGGDNVFCFSTSAAPVADLVVQGAPLRKIASGIRDVRMLTNSTTTAVLANLVRRLWERPLLNWSQDISFLSEPVMGYDHSAHPWLIAAADAPPGKRRHIRLLAKAQAYGEGLVRQQDRPLVLPLLSAPIVEACLKVPSWEWIRGGQDRSLARRAFSHLLPRDIRDRRNKAGLSALFSRIFVDNRERIREEMLDGFLVGAGILDRKALDISTAADAPPRGFQHYRLIELLEVEYWTRGFQF